MILRQIVEGMQDMHNVNIIHRDLKLANILLHFPQEDLLALSKDKRMDFIGEADLREVPFEIKITDFGFAKKIQPRSRYEN